MTTTGANRREQPTRPAPRLLCGRCSMRLRRAMTAESRAIGECGSAVVVADGAALSAVLANPDAAVLDICCGPAI